MNALIDLPTWLTGAPSADDVQAYIDCGWSLVPIPSGAKAPTHKGWNLRAEALKSSADLPEGWGIGLAHAYSGTCALDIDALDNATTMLARHGIDLQALLDAPDAVQIVSGREGRAKLLYRMFNPLPSKKIAEGNTTIYELRCATTSGLTVQDVLPPSVHPQTGKPYRWAGHGHWTCLPVIPQALLDLWRSKLATDHPMTSTASTDATWTEIAQALEHVNPDCSRQDWITVGMGLHAHGAQCNQIDHALTVWDTWSAKGKKYPGPRDLAQQWHSFRNDKATTVTMGSVFKLARDAGWVRPPVDASVLFRATGSPCESVEAQPRYKLLGSADIAALPALAWRVRGVLPAVGLAGLYGPSASGKSFLGFDMAAAIADGARWFNCRVAAAPVVYAALEGEAGFKLRVKAWETHKGRNLPDGLRLVLQPFKLTERQDVQDLAAVVPAGAVVVIDTLNRAAPMADENSSRDMGEILEAAKRLQALTGGLVVLVHHTGKDPTKGLRGHSSLFAALDAAIEVSRDGDRREWKVAKSKDGQDGDAHPFKLQVETLGLDEYGDASTSCVVVPDLVAQDVQRVKLPQGGNQRVVLDALRPMFKDGETGKPGAPALSPCIQLEAAITKASGHLTCETRRRVTRAREAITGLVARGVLSSNEGWIWMAA